MCPIRELEAISMLRVGVRGPGILLGPAEGWQPLVQHVWIDYPWEYSLGY